MTSLQRSERARAARSALAQCRLCAHDCGVNRLAGERGLCRATDEARVFSAQIEVADEMELIPTFAIALSGCDLRCEFCISAAESWNPRAGEPLDAERLVAQAAGARTVMILGGEPTVHLPAALEIAAALPDETRLVWKTNAHGSAQARELLDGVFDVWLADYKFGKDECALRLARVENYSEVARENLLWAATHSELIVRHLLMPGHVDCCWKPIARWLAEELPGEKVSLRTGFWPTGVSGAETERAFAIARDYGLNLIE